MFKKGDRVTLKKDSEFNPQQGTAKFGTILNDEHTSTMWIKVRWGKGCERREDVYPVKDLLLIKPQKLMDLAF